MVTFWGFVSPIITVETLLSFLDVEDLTRLWIRETVYTEMMFCIIIYCNRENKIYYTALLLFRSVI